MPADSVLRIRSQPAPEPHKPSAETADAVARNPGTPLHTDWIEGARVNLSAVERRAATLTTRRTVKKEWQAAWLVKAITCIDLTTLAGDDTPARVQRLCAKAQAAAPRATSSRRSGSDETPTVGAVCVYPTMVRDGGEGARRLGHSRRFGGDRLSRRPDAAAAAARGNPLCGRRGRARRSTSSSPARMCSTRTGRRSTTRSQAMREACGEAHLKAILATGDLKTLRNVYRASAWSPCRRAPISSRPRPARRT